MAEKLYTVKESDLVNIADAIRLKRDTTTPIKVEDMPLEIGLIEGGGVPFFSKIASGQFTPSTNIQTNSNPYTVTHNLGVEPRFIFVFDEERDSVVVSEVSDKGNLWTLYYFKNNGLECMTTCGCIAGNDVFSMVTYFTGSTNEGYKCIVNVTSSEFTIKAYTTNGHLIENHTYKWIAMA